MATTYQPRYSMRFSPLRVTIWIAFIVGVLVPMMFHRAGNTHVARRLLWPGRTIVDAFRIGERDIRIDYIVNFVVLLLVVYVIVFFTARVRHTD
jgi:hypothetical protein